MMFHYFIINAHVKYQLKLRCYENILNLYLLVCDCIIKWNLKVDL